jgi:hypothetical protein
VNATTGATLWTVTAAAEVRAAVSYDAATNRMFVPTNGSGIQAYDLASSNMTTPPSAASPWSNPGGTYRLPCTRGSTTSADLACVDTAGVLRVVGKADGALKASHATGVATPSTLWPVTGIATPGFVVSSASAVQRLQVTGAPLTVTPLGQWTPAGLTLSSVQVFGGLGTIVVGASDKMLHKLSLADASDTGQTATINPEPGAVIVGSPAYDVTNDLFVFGTSDGRVWAVKAF